MSILSNLLPSSTDNAILYTAKSSTPKLEPITIFVHNKETTSKTYSIAIVEKGATPEDKDYLANGIPLPSKHSNIWNLNISEYMQVVVSVGGANTINFVVMEGR